ncbi:crossover junction endodeoxyribonuclease RuvC [bacterium]|nr:crossover junction endodeoxyribonuclease RuvC [bacterium]
MRVLAIDPGFGRCGFAVVDRVNGKEKWINSMCVETSSKLDFYARLAGVANECSRLITEFKPDTIALEKLFVSNNQKTAMNVAEVRGALIYVAHEAGLPIYEYTPMQVKAAVTGWGGSDKTAVSRLLHALLKIDKKVLLDDEYDAIGIAVTHLASVR